MAEISTQAVINAITLALRAAYPEAIILDDEATPGIEPGAFVVQLVSADQQPLTGSLRRRNPQFDVIYFSAGSGEECVRVADNLCTELGTVTTPGGDQLHGAGISWRVDDHVLHFMVGYPHHILHETEQSFMETLNIGAPAESQILRGEEEQGSV